MNCYYSHKAGVQFLTNKAVPLILRAAQDERVKMIFKVFPDLHLHGDDDTATITLRGSGSTPDHQD